MATDLDSLSRDELYDRYNMPRAGRIFAAYLLPVIEQLIDVESDIETETHDEVLAEVALWKAFDNEPKWKPFIIVTGLVAVYDYLFPLPFGVYGLSIVGFATLLGLVPSVRGRYLLAAEHAGKTDEDGIPADLKLKAMSVASSAVSLVFISIGITVQLMATSGIVGAEFLSQNRIVGGPIPPIVTIGVLLAVPYVYGLIQNKYSQSS